MRGRVANKCEGRPLSLPIYLFFFGVAFCQEEKPSWLPDRSVSPSQRLMWLQGLSVGKETRALSEDPLLHLLSLSPFLVVWWKPVSSGVCVEGKRRLFLFPSQLCWLLCSRNLHCCLTSCLYSETLLARLRYRKQDCQGVTSKLAKAHTPVHVAVYTNHIKMIDHMAEKHTIDRNLKIYQHKVIIWANVLITQRSSGFVR